MSARDRYDFRPTGIYRRSDGFRAGFLDSHGERVVFIGNGFAARESRLLWIFFHGPIPDGYDVRGKLNNQIANLRLCRTGEK